MNSGGYKTVWLTNFSATSAALGQGDWDTPKGVAGGGCNQGWQCNITATPGKQLVALSIGYSLSSLLQSDGSLVLHNQKQFEVYPETGDLPGYTGVEDRQDILAVGAGNGMVLVIVDPKQQPIHHAPAAGRDPPSWWPGLPPGWTAPPGVEAA